MGQREDVQASLLAGHGVDSVARRKVADQVKAVVAEGAREIEDESPDVSADELATAASAVVLASDLRAPRPTRGEFLRGLAQRIEADGEVVLVPSAPNRQGWRARLANVERLLAEFWNDGDAIDDLMGEDWAKVQQALAEIRAMLDGQ